MAIALGSLLAMVSIAVLAYPFLGSKRYRFVSESSVNREILRAERQRIYRKIKDLEADLSSGDLTKPDFMVQRDQLRVSAAEVLRNEATSAPKVRNEQLEREIALIRKQIARSAKS